MHRLAKADYIDRQKIVDEILYPERKVEPKPNTKGAAPEPGESALYADAENRIGL